MSNRFLNLWEESFILVPVDDLFPFLGFRRKLYFLNVWDLTVKMSAFISHPVQAHAEQEYISPLFAETFYLFQSCYHAALVSRPNQPRHFNLSS